MPKQFYRNYFAIYRHFDTKQEIYDTLEKEIT